MAFICPEPNCNREFDSKGSLARHRNWHRPGYRKSLSKIHKEVWNQPGFRESMSGENNPIYGKFGKESSAYKEDAKYKANHRWIRIHYPPEEFCNKCEICEIINLNLNLAQFRHVNVRNMEDPMVDYLYICPRTEKNSCHRIYDTLSDKQKKELLEGAITREEKLERVREYVLKIKKYLLNGYIFRKFKI